MDNQNQTEATIENLEANSVPSEISTEEERMEDIKPAESEDTTQTVVKETTSVAEGVSLEDKLSEQEGIIAILNKEIVALRQQLQSQEETSEAMKTQSLRMAADFENFRRRTIKEKQDLEQQIKGNTIKELLPVIDNFERARSQIKPNSEGEMAIHKSYQGVYKQLVDTLKKLGVSAMRPEGEPFDPNFHEAMVQEPTDQHPEGTVIEQIVRGYLLGEQVLRYSMVKVAAPPPPQNNEPSAETSNQEASASEI